LINLTKKKFFILFSFVSCATFVTRPEQEMYMAKVALQSAKEVQADILVPEMYQSAVSWYNIALKNYSLKFFHKAIEAIKTSRILAEQAEYESLRKGAVRSGVETDDIKSTAEKPHEAETNNQSSSLPHPPNPPDNNSVLASEYEAHQEEEARKKAEAEKTAAEQNSNPPNAENQNTPQPMILPPKKPSQR
jgi:hypothetical protein